MLEKDAVLMIDKNDFRPKPVDEAALDVALAAFQALDDGARTGEWRPSSLICMQI